MFENALDLPLNPRPTVWSGAASDSLAQQWTSSAQARSGEAICIRPLRPDDREREIAFINGLSAQSRYFRWLTPLKVLPPHLVDQLMDVDYRRRMAFVATIEREGKEEFVGIARYGEADEEGTAELGITVADAWQRRGIARLLVTELIRFARWRGMTRLSGIVLPENAPMLALAASLGFKASYDRVQHLMVISRELPDLHQASSEDGAGQMRARCADISAGEIPQRN
jgi:RimJ/RimL family protein N-acetyltransferase